jgi:hypothetical protein
MLNRIDMRERAIIYVIPVWDASSADSEIGSAAFLVQILHSGLVRITRELAGGS